MAKTAGELFHSAKKKKRRKTKKKKVLYDTNSNAFLTIPFLTPYTTQSLQKQLTCAREGISYDQPPGISLTPGEKMERELYLRH